MVLSFFRVCAWSSARAVVTFSMQPRTLATDGPTKRRILLAESALPFVSNPTKDTSPLWIGAQSSKSHHWWPVT